LIELMITVVVLSILASLGMVGYRRYVAKARSSEAVAMLAEMASKEQVYFLEFAQYLPLVAGAAVTPVTVAGNASTETANQFYPRDPSVAGFDSVRTAASTAALPLSWQYVAVRPRDNVLYCSYFAGAGLPNSKPPADPVNTVGGAVLGTAAIAQNWYYAMGSCNLRGNGAQTYPAMVTNYIVSYNSPSMTVMDEGQ
jgi:Tfp pilus assembly protein PilE